MTRRRVVITGLGPVTPIGVGVTNFWNALLEGRNGVRRLQSFDPGRFPSQIGGEIDNVSVADFVPKSYRKGAKIMARDIVLSVACAHQAVADAGLRTKCLLERGDVRGEPNVDSARLGVNIGAGAICADLPELAEALASSVSDGKFDLLRWGAEGMNNLTPLWLLKFLPNMLACHVTIVHDAQGPSNTITCGEASSHLAIGEAFRTIERGVADVCICGGAESKSNPMAVIRQSLGKRLSRQNAEPAKACRPYAADRDGTVVSEGGGLVILEALEHAQGRGARIYAEVVGFGASSATGGPLPAGQVHGDTRALRLAAHKALRDANITADRLGLLAGCGFGIVECDRREAAAFRELLGDGLARVPVLSIKGGLGNNGAGSGAIDFIAATLALHNATLPAAINSSPIEPECGLRLATSGPVDAPAEYAISTAFSLTGAQHAALVLRRFREGGA